MLKMQGWFSSLTAHRHRGTAGLSAGALAIALILSGCSSDSDSSDHAADQHDKSGGASSDVEALTEPIHTIDMSLPAVPDGAKQLAGKKVLVVPFATAIFSSMQASIAEGVEAAGGSVSVCDGKVSPSEIETCLASAKPLGVDAVVTIAISPVIAPNGYKMLADNGIPAYAAWQSPGDATDTDALRFQDNGPALTATLHDATDYALATSDQTPNFLIVGNKDTQSTEDQSNEWIDYTKNACPDCDVTTLWATTAQLASLPTDVSSEMLKNPDINTILAFNIDLSGPPVIQGLVNSANKPRVGGNGSGGAALSLVKDGRLTFDVGVSLYFDGWAAVDGLIRMLADVPAVTYPPAIRIFNADNVQDLDLDPANETSFVWFGDAPFSDDFKTAWGL